MIESLEKELIYLSNKARYIKENVDGTIDLRKKPKNIISEMLISKNYSVIDEDTDFKYLVKMPMDSVTEENMNKLFNDHKSKQEELNNLRNTTEIQMWLNELETLKREYLKYKEQRQQLQNNTSEKTLIPKKRNLVIKK